MTSAAPLGSPSELSQLLRLRKVRVDAAQAQVAAQRSACEAALTAVQTRLASIEKDRQQVAQHRACSIGPDAADLPSLGHIVRAFASKLDDALERNEYALIDDEAALEQNQSELRRLHQAWLREQSRADGVQQTLARSRRALAQQRETQAEDALDELPRTHPLTRNSHA
jgi:flagellar biosynthesis chaperone FliJ